MTPRTTCLLAVALILGGCYRTSRFRGGTLSDSGLFSYPRYHASLQPLPLDTPARYAFPISGLPSERMTLLFYVVGANHAAREALQAVSTPLQVSLDRVGTGPICSAQGSLGPSWVLMSNVHGAAFWQRVCTDLPIRSEAAYVLHVEVGSSASAATHRMLVPTLEGGGNELP